MFQRLRQKWNVTPRQFWIIFIAFGCTGLTAAFLTKTITGWLGMTEDTWWVYRWMVKLAMLLFGYQFLLLFYGALFGQWRFFWNFEKMMLQKLGILKPGDKHSFSGDVSTAPGLMSAAKTNHDQKIHLSIFASGAGSNARKIIDHFSANPAVTVQLIVCNKPHAGVLQIAKEKNVDTLEIEKERFFRGDGYVEALREAEIDLVILAGFLWKIPAALIAAYPNRIINIHPALLPKYGGKGMYGNFVHQAVIAGGETQSGITIHYVDGHYDNGDIIAQVTCPVLPGDTPEKLAARIHQLEYAHYPQVIEQVISKMR